MLALVMSVLLSILAPTADSTDEGDRPVLRAQRIDGGISVDGRLAEDAWAAVPAATGFRQLEPQEGEEPSQETEVHVLYGRNALYVGAMLYDERPDRVRDRLTRRDQRNEADWFEVSIDSYLDRQTARTFAVNAAGVQRDGIVRSGSADQRSFNASWDAIWRSAVRITDRGWVAELRIPYDMLRFSEADRQTWGLQFRRRIPRTSEVLEWPLVPRSERQASLVAEYGRLTGLQGLRPDRRVEVSPYVLGRARTQENPDVPGTIQSSGTADVGVDAEIGLGSNATLDATINPDFGQVESDPSVLNLTAFETFFPEKRPFFIQGTDIFNFPLGLENVRGSVRSTELFYTRRIGAVDPVVGALKLTGRTQGGLSYGVLGATTGPEFRPERGYAVGRAEQQLGARSTIGGIVTAFDGPAGPSTAGRRRSVVGGADWDLRFDNGTYRVEGHLTGSHRRTTAGAATPSTGAEITTEFEKLQGDWTYDAGVRIRTPEYNPNDLGRLRRNNQVRFSSFVRHQFNGGQPVGPFQDLSGFFTVNQSWSYDRGLNRGTEPYLEFQGLTDGFRPLTLSVDGKNLFGGVDLFETRGLGPRARPTAAISTIRIGTDARRSWQLTPRVSWTARSDAGWAWSAGLDAEWNVGSRLKLSGGLSYEQELGVVEWAANETFVRRGPDDWAIGSESAPPSDLAAGDLSTLSRGTDALAAALSDVSTAGTSIDGQPTYYVPVYGGRDTERLNLTLRSNVALTTDLSFEFFGQLFAARGRYRDFRILSDTDDFDAFGAYPRRHDFARSSFIANAVLRWEFRPGSELFVVWSQDRRLRRDDPFFRDRRASSPYDRPTGQRLTDAFRDVPRNAFLVKLRYTIR
jgi:hypothetical protein